MMMWWWWAWYVYRDGDHLDIKPRIFFHNEAVSLHHPAGFVITHNLLDSWKGAWYENDSYNAVPVRRVWVPTVCAMHAVSIYHAHYIYDINRYAESGPFLFIFCWSHWMCLWKSWKLPCKAPMGTHTRFEIFLSVNILVAGIRLFPTRYDSRLIYWPPFDQRQHVRIPCKSKRSSFLTTYCVH